MNLEERAADACATLVQYQLPYVLAELKKLDKPRIPHLFCRKEVTCFCIAGILDKDDFMREFEFSIDYLKGRITANECRKVDSIYSFRDGDLIWIRVHVWV